MLREAQGLVHRVPVIWVPYFFLFTSSPWGRVAETSSWLVPLLGKEGWGGDKGWFPLNSLQGSPQRGVVALRRPQGQAGGRGEQDDNTVLQVLEEKNRKGRGSDTTGFQYQSNLKHAGHGPPQFSSPSAPVSFPVTPRCVPPSSFLLAATQIVLVPNIQQSLWKTVAGMKWVNRQI